MSEFFIYLKIGFRHIVDLGGYDHMLFVATLCLAQTAAEWKRLLILVTAFTLGHCVTLALSTLGVVLVPSAWIEFLIPVTIIVSAMLNLTALNKNSKWHYALVLFFGLVHGLGFSNYLKGLIGGQNIVSQLFAFNVGLEIGQLFIIAIIMAFLGVLTRTFRLDLQKVRFIFCWVIIGLAVNIAFEKFLVLKESF